MPSMHAYHLFLKFYSPSFSKKKSGKRKRSFNKYDGHKIERLEMEELKIYGKYKYQDQRVLETKQTIRITIRI